MPKRLVIFVANPSPSGNLVKPVLNENFLSPSALYFASLMENSPWDINYNAKVYQIIIHQEPVRPSTKRQIVHYTILIQSYK